MADLTFAQSSRRNYTAPVLIAVAILVAIGGLMYHHYVGRIVTATIPHTEVFPVRVILKEQARQAQGFKILNDKPASHDEGVYILATVHIENHLTTPLFLKDFHATLDTADGQYRSSAIEKNDLPTVTAAFPELSSRLANPLLRESTISPGQSADGVIVLQYPITESAWQARTASALTMDFYHQDSIDVAFPKP